ncbi:hypothetical protein ACLOJK_013495 [Asimina triloba]
MCGTQFTVGRFGADLQGLKDKMPDAEFILDTHGHIISGQNQRDWRMSLRPWVLLCMLGGSVRVCNKEPRRVPRAVLKMEELFRALFEAFMASNGSAYRYRPSPGCPAVYQVADPGVTDEQPPFTCGASLVKTCTVPFGVSSTGIL